MSNGLNFNDEEIKYLKNIAQYYALAKELLIFGEQIDPEGRTLTQPLNEMRNCLDHLMRVFLYHFGLGPMEAEKNYTETNLDKSYGHIYRAAYDTLDWISLTLKEIINNKIKIFSIETIQNVIPEYYKNIKPRFEEIINMEIAALRNEKDVAVRNEENLIKYTKITAELKDIYNEIINKESSLVELEIKQKKSKRTRLVIDIILAIIASGSLLSWFIYWLVNR